MKVKRRLSELDTKRTVKMTDEDRAYFKAGIKTLCGEELVFAGNVINDKDLRKRFTPEDLVFMNKELGRQAGAIWARLLRALKKHDFEAAVEVMRGKGGGNGEKESMEATEGERGTADIDRETAAGIFELRRTEKTASASVSLLTGTIAASAGPCLTLRNGSRKKRRTRQQSWAQMKK